MAIRARIGVPVSARSSSRSSSSSVVVADDVFDVVDEDEVGVVELDVADVVRFSSTVRLLDVVVEDAVVVAEVLSLIHI